METNPREAKGRELATRGNIKHVSEARYAVPSLSGISQGYVVDLVDSRCTCPDYELRGGTCLHQHAVMYWLAWERDVAADGVVTETATVVVKRQTYRPSEGWSTYNAASTHEKERVEVLLKSLCDGIEQPVRAAGTPGRKPLPVGDAVFGAAMKVLTTFSGRRASTEIRDCAERGQIANAMHYNSVFRTLENPATTAILTRLIEESAAPLAELENAAGQFATDSTGFSTAVYERYFSVKHQKVKSTHPWVKLHATVGTLTNVVTAVKVSDEADCPVMAELAVTTARRFKMREMSGDKAYLSTKNLEAIDALGATAFIPFKINSVGNSKSELWRRAFCLFMLRREEFAKHYHRRSNVETTFWMIKSKFGSAVRSKLATAQVNEVLCKVLLHNLTCLVHAVEEHEIEVEFWKSALALMAVAS